MESTMKLELSSTFSKVIQSEKKKKRSYFYSLAINNWGKYH